MAKHQHTIDDRRYLTLSQARELTQLSLTTLRRAIRRRQLAVARIGRTIRIPVDGLNDYLDARTTPASSRRMACREEGCR